MFANICLLIGIGNSFLLMVFIAKRRSELGGNFLVILFAILAGTGWLRYLLIIKSQVFVYLTPFILSAAFLAGPIAYAYFKKIATGENLAPALRKWSFFIIPSVVFIGYLIAFLVEPAFRDLQVHLELSGTVGVSVKLLIVSGTGLATAWLIAIVRVVLDYRTRENEVLYRPKSSQFTWMVLLLACLASQSILLTGGALASVLLGENLIFMSLDVVAFLLSPFMILYYMTNGPEIIPIQNNISKYAKQSLSGEKSLEYLETIKSVMVSQQLFKDDHITLAELAKQADLPAHHVSMVINTEMGMNFYQFVNHYRVEEVKKLLKNADPTMSVLRIGFRAGFQSKGAFHTIFKKHTGMTPTRFREVSQNASE